MELAYKLRFIPFILGLITLLIGLALRYVIFATEGYRVIYYGALLTVLGFIFLQAMRGLKQEENAATDTAVQSPHSEEARVSQNEEIRATEYSFKNKIPFMIVRAIGSLLVVLFGISIIMNGPLIFGIVLLLLGTVFFILHAMWAMQYLQELKKLTAYKNSSANAFKSKEIIVPGFNGESPVLRVFDNGTTTLVFELFPPENEKLVRLVPENFAEILSAYIGVKVAHADREMFIVMSNDEKVINKILLYFAE